jgi:hypothetical protein
MRAVIGIVLLLAGCATSQEYVASTSDFTVCRFTMGGPHARAAEEEARKRGLNCPAMYPAILQKQAQENAATQTYINSLQRPAPAPMMRSCNSYRMGNTVQTDCQ